MKKLVINEIKKTYPNGFVLNNVKFELTSGEVFSYIGPNGSGKTTTLRIILGTVKPESGRIEFVSDNKDLKIGFVLEDEQPFDELTPIEYLEFFAEAQGVTHRNFDEILAIFKLDLYKNQKNKTLSKGNKKKLCLAKALLSDPDILLLDEPFEGIEPDTRREIRDYLINFASGNKIIIVTSHNLYEIENFANTFGIIYNGNFLGKWKIKEIKDKGTSLEDFYLDKIKEFKNV